ncbi:hypothetical protein ZYGR_0AL00550 [Zygosaccharomyces rouxii]|uniref:RRM domain-containing protein n=1 Tax=Zygosaccharomyces rouxii TaxID=4956 RepID=A0A1Q3AFR9_ZYGRO|nr:hypothetical protein ZYGR_0AL00550 [Zygosaccharomyces rouxii]
MGNEDNEHALEDLRSKIIASMSNEPGPNKRTVLAGDEMHSNKRQRNRDDGGRSYKNGHSGPNYLKRHQSNPRSRYQMQQQQKRFPPRPQYSRYQGNTAPNTSAGKFREEDLAYVVPLNERKRMRPTRWDITPKGFENVPAERAKLSKLFPQPGKPHELDRDKLEKVITQGGSSNRRTKILFEDADGNHLIFSKISCKIVVRGTRDSMNLNHIETFLNGFVQTLDREYHLKEIVQGPSHLVLEFNDVVCTTIVLSCRSFLSKELGFDGSDWQRPQEYVQQVDTSERLCGPEILAVEGLVSGEERELTDQGFKVVFMEPVFTTSQENPLDKIFTGCALVEVEEKPSENGLLRWFKPNESRMKQNVSYMTFQGLPKLTKDQVRVPSRVVLLMNLVDPLDLKLEAFAQEVETTLKSTLDKVENVKVKKPSADFRLNLERIGEGVGNVYVKFQDVESAESAMENLPHRKFNGRSVLCCYVSESDFETLGIL